MQDKTMKQRLADGQTLRVMSLGALVTPKFIEVVGCAAPDANLDGVWLDQEHSGMGHRELETLLMACRSADLPAFVRVAPTDYATVMRPYEAGAAGVMAAQVRSVEQVKQIVRWSYYPPLGERGLFGGNYESSYGGVHPRDVVERHNADRWLLIQIETAEAVACVDDIAALPGVDTLFVGPGDLAATLGVPGESMHAKCQAAIDRVAQACEHHGKTWAALSREPEHAAYCAESGCRLLSLATDVGAVRSGIEVTMKTLNG